MQLNVPDRISRDDYVAMFAAAGLAPEDVTKVEFRSDGIYATVLARDEDGSRILVEPDDRDAVHRIYIPVAQDDRDEAYHRSREAAKCLAAAAGIRYSLSATEMLLRISTEGPSQAVRVDVAAHLGFDIATADVPDNASHMDALRLITDHIRNERCPQGRAQQTQEQTP